MNADSVFKEKKSDGTESPCLTLKDAQKCKFASKSCFFAWTVRLRNDLRIRKKPSRKNGIRFPVFPLFNNSSFGRYFLFSTEYEQKNRFRENHIFRNETAGKAKHRPARKKHGKRKSILCAKNRRKSHFRRFYSSFSVPAPTYRRSAISPPIKRFGTPVYRFRTTWGRFKTV